MKVVTLADISERLATGQRAGEASRELADLSETVFQTVQTRVSEREAAMLQAMGPDLAPVLVTVEELIQSTDGLGNVIELVAQASGARFRAESLLDSTVDALTSLKHLADAGIPPGVFAANASDAISSAATTSVNPVLSANGILGTGVLAPSAEATRARIAGLTLIRLWSLHALVLLRTAISSPTTTVDVQATRLDAEQQVRQLRDALRGRLAVVRQRSSADPAFSLGIAAAVLDAEEWIVGAGGEAVAESLHVATEAADAGSAQSESLSRDAAIAYDGVRQLLALLAGARRVQTAYALFDRPALERMSVASSLPLSSATLDLPRSSLGEAAGAVAGTVVEVAAMVLSSDEVVGGPAPRSVLLLGTPNGNQLTVLVPFAAVSAFGVHPGAWVQVRGEIHPDGKDGIDGPVLMVRRIRRGDAATGSITDALIWEGRHEFDLRPHGLDIVAGRRGGDPRTVDELGLSR